jgi:shikimate kinase
MNLERIYLTRFMGSGKSTVGRMVAHMFRWPYSDLDEIIAKKAGMSIPEICQQEGEGTFRRMETEVVRKSAEKKGVIALGGGALMNRENREILLASGTVVNLKAATDTLVYRLQARTDNRPLLSGEGRLEDRITGILKERPEIYSMAHWTVDTDEMAPQKLAGTIYSLDVYGLFMDVIDG